MTPPSHAPEVGQVVEDGEYATLVFVRRLPHPPERVWRALTEPEELATWYMTRAALEGRPGGRVDFHAGPSQLHVQGRILTWDPPRVLEHEWKVAARPELPGGEDAVIRWELAADPQGTVLRLTHRRLRRATAVGFAPGTHAFLDRLAARLDGTPMPGWQERYREVAPHYPPSWTNR